MGGFAGQGSYCPIKRPDGSTNVINVDGQRVPQQGYITDEITEYALTWLQEQRDVTKPLLSHLAQGPFRCVNAPRHQAIR